MLWVASTIAISLSSCAQPNSDTPPSHQNQADVNIQQEKTKIESLLFSYRDALNASDVAAVLPLYASDGVFMPSGAPTSAGPEQVQAAYEFVFSNIQLKIEFFIDDITVNDDYAYARTTSRGSTLIHASGETVPEENRELFVLRKENGAWRIAQYMFNKMQ